MAVGHDGHSRGHHIDHHRQPADTFAQWLLPEPLPLAERNAWPGLQGRPLQRLGDPERIETGGRDGDSAARDCFIAAAEDGSRVRVYRGRRPVR